MTQLALLPTEQKALPAPKDVLYPMPGYVNGDFLDTENVLTTKEVFGLVQISTGQIWEIRQLPVQEFEKGGIEPVTEVMHGGALYPLWRVDVGGERWLTDGNSVPWSQHYSVDDCVYKAVDKFMESTGIGRLSPGDGAWFKYHPNITENGAARGTVLGVVHGLVLAYGLSVDRVYMPKLSSLGEEHKLFAAALGMNPGAIATNAISNQEYVESLGGNKEVAEAIDAMCKFEFVDKPKGPCVVLMNSPAAVQASSKVANTARKDWVAGASFTMGHADYIGPRDMPSSGWLIAFTLKRGASPVGLEHFGDVDVAASKAEKLNGTSKQQPKRTLSIYQSLFGGKSLNEFLYSSQKKSGAAIADDKPKTVQGLRTPPGHIAVCPHCLTVVNPYSTYGNKEPLAWCKECKKTVTPKIVEDVQATPQKDDDEPCPFCDGHDVEKTDDVCFCMSCERWWWVDENDNVVKSSGVTDISNTVCPFCNAELAADKMKLVCDDCGYDSDSWRESYTAFCAKHNIAVYENLDTSGMLCPDCLWGDMDLSLYVSGKKKQKLELLT